MNEFEKKTREQLEAYRSKKEEIAELEERMKHIKEESMEHDIIMDYKKGYPRPQAIVGLNVKKYDNAMARYRSRLEKLREECEEIEKYVEDIEDSMTRRIFRMYFLDGVSQKKVAQTVHLSQSVVSKRIALALKKM